MKCDGTRAETRFRLSAKRTSPFKSAGTSVQSTTGSRGVSVSGINAGYTMFRGSVKGTGYPLHSPVSPSLPLPCVTVCHHNSTGVYQGWSERITSDVSRTTIVQSHTNCTTLAAFVFRNSQLRFLSSSVYYSTHDTMYCNTAARQTTWGLTLWSSV